MEGRKFSDGDIPMMSSPSHVRHCTDLLRQSLMCNAHMTVEQTDLDENDVSGFGVMHKCAGWDELIELIGKRQGDEGLAK